MFSIREKLEKIKSNVAQSKAAVKSLETSKTEPEKKLLLYKEMIGDMKFWDRCIDEIQQLKKIVDDLEIRMNNAGDANCRRL